MKWLAAMALGVGVTAGCTTVGSAAQTVAPPSLEPTSAMRPSPDPTAASPRPTESPTIGPTATPALTFAPETITSIPLPDLGGGLTSFGEHLWDGTDSGLVRVDPTTGSVSEPIVGLQNTAVGGDRLWAGGDRRLVELEPTSGAILREFELEKSAYYVAASSKAVWATDTIYGIVQRIDPSSGEVLATIRTPSRPKGTAVGLGSVWVACDDAGKVVRIDPATNEIVAEIKVGTGPHNISIGGGWVWVTSRKSSTLAKIDPDTNAVAATIEGVATSPAVGVIATDDSVWVAYTDGVAEVDPENAVVTRRFSVPGAFYDLKMHGGRLWASDAATATLFGFELP